MCDYSKHSGAPSGGKAFGKPRYSPPPAAEPPKQEYKQKPPVDWSWRTVPKKSHGAGGKIETPNRELVKKVEVMNRFSKIDSDS